MQIRANQLDKAIRSEALPVYLVWGEEPLLVDEAAAGAIDALLASGFEERTRIDMTTGGDWNEVFFGARNMSLFATRRVMDVRLPAKGLDRTASDALRRYLDAPVDDTAFVLRAVGLDWRQKSTAWFKAIDKVGATVQIWPVTGAELPRWLEGRAKRFGLQLGPDAVDLLVEQVEGNLLAAQQVFEKLKLVDHQGAITADDLGGHVGDAAHYDTFEMIDTALAGDGPRAIRMARVLRREGVAVFMVLAALVNQLRRLHEAARGGNVRLAKQRAQKVQAAARRLGAHGVEAILAECALLDLQSKGMLRGDAWQSLERVLLAIAGRGEAHLERDQAHLRTLD